MRIENETGGPAGLVERLRDGYPVMGAPADDSRLGRMLARLAAALDAAEVERPVPASVRADMLDHVPRLRRYAAALTCDPAEADALVQSTLLEAWTKRERLPGGPALAAWLFAVLRRSDLRDRCRSSTGRPPESDGDGSARAAGDAPGQRAVRDAVDRLPRAQREALLLVTVEGLSWKAAAAIIDCPEAVVRDRLVQAHDRLARALGSV